MASFVPRSTFSFPTSLPKSYYIGHHVSGMKRISEMLPNTGLIIECRDSRLPLTTKNATLDRLVAGCPRIVVYTKADLGATTATVRHQLRDICKDPVFFWEKNKTKYTRSIVTYFRSLASEQRSILGLHVLVVGMPNVGKSSLLNSLRSLGGASSSRGKVAQTSNRAGCTRKLSTRVCIIPPHDKGGVAAGVYLVDSPGVFNPFVNDGETMVKIALAHGIKEGLIDDEILADYLLYRLNLWDPSLYKHYCPPTNHLEQLLVPLAHRLGKLRPGGLPNTSDAAVYFLNQWRHGLLGHNILDDISEQSLRLHEALAKDPPLSLSQAMKAQKLARMTK